MSNSGNVKIEIATTDHIFAAELFDTPTGQAIRAVLPFDATVNTWGDEIYFATPAHAHLETDASDLVSLGDLAYWPTLPAFCIFFGATPASIADEPRAASKVSVFGRLLYLDLDKLRSVPDGEKITVRKVSTN